MRMYPVFEFMYHVVPACQVIVIIGDSDAQPDVFVSFDLVSR